MKIYDLEELKEGNIKNEYSKQNHKNLRVTLVFK